MSSSWLLSVGCCCCSVRFVGVVVICRSCLCSLFVVVVCCLLFAVCNCWLSLFIAYCSFLSLLLLL